MPSETDVIVAPSTTEAVNTEAQPTQTEKVNIPAQGDVQQSVPASNVAAVDKIGVPLDNREAEWKRKHEQLVDRIPEYIDQAVQEAVKTVTSAPKQEQYSPEQLRMVLYDDTGTYNAANKVWAQQELDRINEQKMGKLLDEKFQLSQKHQRDQQVKVESEAYVVKAFPEMFKRDVNGNVVGWDTENPMTQLTAQYMKQIGNRPDAVREAARQAFVDYQLMNKNQTEKKAQLANAEVAQLKRQNITSGGGNAEISSLNTKVAEAFEKFKKTGSVTDAKEYNMLKGRLSAMQLKGK